MTSLRSRSTAAALGVMAVLVLPGCSSEPDYCSQLTTTQEAYDDLAGTDVLAEGTDTLSERYDTFSAEVDQLGRESEPFAFLPHEVGGPADVRVVVALGTHAGDLQELDQLGDVPVAPVVEVVEDLFAGHAHLLLVAFRHLRAVSGGSRDPRPG